MVSSIIKTMVDLCFRPTIFPPKKFEIHTVTESNEPSKMPQ